MQLHFTFKHIESDPNLQEFVSHKSETLKKYFEGKISLNWVFSIERQNKIAHCHLLGNHMDYFAEGISTNFPTSAEIALEKVEKQIHKHKEIIKNHHSQRLGSVSSS